MSARIDPTRSAQPTWWASLAVRSAALPLPAEHRNRYRQEFMAELYGMAPPDQLRHAAGVLSRVATLRLALVDPGRHLTKEAAMAKRWRCRFRLHRWQTKRGPTGQPYRECRYCGAMTWPPDMPGAVGGGL